MTTYTGPERRNQTLEGKRQRALYWLGPHHIAATDSTYKYRR